MDQESHPIIEGSGKRATLSSSKFVIIVLILALIVTVSAVFALSIGLGVSVSSSKSGNSGNSGSSTPTPSPSVSSSKSSSSGSLTPTPSPTPSPTTNVCMTASCVELSALVLSGLDSTIDPCDDFYNFSCGGWEKSNVLPQGYGRYSTFDQLNKRNQIALRKILESSEDSGVEAVEKVKTLYTSCIDTDTIDDRGAVPLLELLAATGGWPLVDGSSSNWSINGSQFIAELQVGSPAFFSLYVDVDDHNSSVYILQLSQSGLSLPSPKSYSDNRTAAANLAALQDLIVEVLTLLNPNNSESSYKAAAEEIVAFETSLAKIFVSNVALRDPDKTYNKVAVGNLSSLFPALDWEMAVSTLFESINITVNGSEPIIVRTPSYFTNLTAVYNNATESTLQNYAKWKVALSYLPYLGDSFLSAYYTFSFDVSGQGQKERFDFCIGAAQMVLPIALARPFTDYVLPNGTKEDVSEMIGEVKTAFKQRLETDDWLDNTTKTRCVEKVNAITQMVAYPDQIENSTYLDELYAEYNITETMFFENLLQFFHLSLTENYETLRKPVDKSVWLTAPTAVNAYYSPQFNQFVFLEGILGSPFFQAGWPEYFKYGALGVVIGHELTHGFDDQGQQYNKDGILTPWWTNQSVANFKEKQECFREQYSKYEIFGYKINGSLTLGENIADNGGLKASYQAYQNVVKQGGEPPLLPALENFTQDQLYFIAFGQLWCSIFSKEYIAASTKVDPHSPGPYRVIGALSNSEEFASAFQCKSGDRMDPANKCLMW